MNIQGSPVFKYHKSCYAGYSYFLIFMKDKFLVVKVPFKLCFEFWWILPHCLPYRYFTVYSLTFSVYLFEPPRINFCVRCEVGIYIFSNSPKVFWILLNNPYFPSRLRGKRYLYHVLSFNIESSLFLYFNWSIKAIVLSFNNCNFKIL